MKISIAKEGIFYVTVALCFGVIFFLFFHWTAGFVFVLIAFFVLSFFRYPDRSLMWDGKTIYAPADGRIICIKEEVEKDYFNGSVRRISIFMNVFNVHINYSPIDGTVDFIKYKIGNFEHAGRINEEEENENNFLGLVNGNIKIGVRQVAGLVARRIVCDRKKGDAVFAGRRFGLIKFGSRVDVFVPMDYNVCVKNCEKVLAGRTVLARI